MINKLFLKFFLTITALSLSALIMLYIVFISTDKFLDYFDNHIRSFLLTGQYDYQISYLEISGSLSNKLVIEGLELKDINSTFTIDTIEIVPSFSSSFYFFLKSISNSSDIVNSIFKFKTLYVENLKLRKGDASIEFDDIFIHENKIKSPIIKIFLSNYIVIAEDLLISLPYNINSGNMKLNNIINKENLTTLSSVSFTSKSHEEVFRYNDINISPTLFKIKENLSNITINKCDYYYNELKYYFISDFNINTIDEGSELRINSFEVYNDKNKKKIDLFGKIDFTDMFVNIKTTTEKLNYFNLLKPQKGIIQIKGQDYVYNVDFEFKRVKEFVDNTVDEIKGNFTLNFSDSLDYMIHFDEPIRMRDKDYDGTFTISDMRSFNDIYNPSITIGTNRINPFKLNQFKQLD